MKTTWMVAMNSAVNQKNELGLSVPEQNLVFILTEAMECLQILMKAP